MADARFPQTEQRYRQLKAELDAGRITGERFERALWDAMFEADGRWWMLGANTGRWYAFDGQAWLEHDPPAGTTTRLARSDQPPAAPAGPVSMASDRTAAAQVLRALVLAGAAFLIFISLWGAVEGWGTVGGTIAAGFGLLIIGAIVAGLRARRRKR